MEICTNIKVFKCRFCTNVEVFKVEFCTNIKVFGYYPLRAALIVFIRLRTRVRSEPESFSSSFK